MMTNTPQQVTDRMGDLTDILRAFRAINKGLSQINAAPAAETATASIHLEQIGTLTLIAKEITTLGNVLGEQLANLGGGPTTPAVANIGIDAAGQKLRLVNDEGAYVGAGISKADLTSFVTVT